jgi:hypothetical protein
MDRVISLLAALVGLIALGGAILVHVNADAERGVLAAQIADIRTSLRTGAALPAEPSVAEIASASSSVASEVSAAPASEAMSTLAAAEPSQSSLIDPAAEISSLEMRVAELERENASQASALALAEGSTVASEASSSAPPSSSVSGVSSVAILGADALAPSSLLSPSSAPESSASSASLAAASGPGGDCIPLGTRFVGKAGDKFAICHSKLEVKILGVSDGQAIVEGAGPIAAGGFGNLTGNAGCTVMVFTADVTGYADLRVTCQ